MTPHEKATHAINQRLERLQAGLREAKAETAQQFLFQSLVVTLGVAEALNDFIRTVGTHAQRRHAEVKQANEALSSQHTDLLQAGQALLERLKANPADRALRKEIEVAQQKMTVIQKTVRRGANALQRELAPSLAMIDQMAVNLRKFVDAEQGDALKRLLRTVLGQVREFYAALRVLPAKDIPDMAAWEKSAVAEIDQAAGYQDAYARTGYQTALALELITLAVSESPPRTAEDAARRANDSLAARIREITGRFTSNSDPASTAAPPPS